MTIKIVERDNNIFHYDEDDNLVYSKFEDGVQEWYASNDIGKTVRVLLPNGLEKMFQYDGLGNEIYYKCSDGTEEWNKYDDRGQLRHFRSSEGYESFYDEEGDLIRKILPNGDRYLWDRTDMGESLTITHPDSTIEIQKWDEDGYLIYHKKPSGWEEVYNRSGNIIHATLESENLIKISYEYDDIGRMIYKKDSEGNEMWYKYDEETGELIYYGEYENGEI